MYLRIEGDLFDQVCSIGQGVNCKGQMAAGIAQSFRSRFPSMYLDYRQLCLQGKLQIGDCFPWWDVEGKRWIYNLATQKNVGPCATLDALKESLTKMCEHAIGNDVRRIALPKIGCGIGGLDWLSVEKVFLQATKNFPDLELLVVSPKW